MKSFFEWALPEFMRARRAPPEELARRLAVMDPSDPAYRALMELLHEQFAAEVTALLRNDLGNAQARGHSRESEVSVTVNQQSGSAAMEYQRGRAASLFYLMEKIEAERVAAREEMIEKRKAENRKQKP